MEQHGHVSISGIHVQTGAVWAPQSCVLVTPGGELPSVESRGDDLNGTAYPSVEATDAFRNGDGGSGCSSFDAGDSSSMGSSNGSNSNGGSGSGSGSMDVFVAGSPIATARNVTLRHDPGPDWLYYGGKWGSTVQVPHCHHVNPVTVVSLVVALCTLGAVREDLQDMPRLCRRFIHGVLALHRVACPHCLLVGMWQAPALQEWFAGAENPGVPHLAADGAHCAACYVCLHHRFLHTNSGCLHTLRVEPCATNIPRPSS